MTSRWGMGGVVQLVPTAPASQCIARIQAFWVERLRAIPEGALAKGIDAVDALTEIAAYFPH